MVALLRPALERRERFERELAPALSGRIEVLEGEIARREEGRLAEIEREPPAYLTDALGPCPEREWGQQRWREGVRALEGYRERRGMTEPQRALGPEPEERLNLGERRSVERTMWEVRAELGYLARAHERPSMGRPSRATTVGLVTTLAGASSVASTTGRAGGWDGRSQPGGQSAWATATGGWPSPSGWVASKSPAFVDPHRAVASGGDPRETE